MKYSLKEVIGIVICAVLLSFALGVLLGGTYTKMEFYNTLTKSIPAPSPQRGYDLNDDKWKMHEYQIDVSERFIDIFDNGRKVGRAAIDWYSPIGKLIEADNK